ncbi:MAG: glycosyl hydrolase, partial [Bacteroidota bacterium]|nr:glycosyl hydrolase [Bacteroidota bacterium]
MTYSRLLFSAILVFLFAVYLPAELQAQEFTDRSKAEFKTPPASAMPRAWWHWTNSNVTKDGITKDLEWMKRVGIAGMHLSDVASGNGQTVPTKILFWSPEWFDAVKFSASEAERLGLEMSIFSSAGWSLTGGPWVKPEEAMKKLVWSEITVNGGKPYTGKLPQPPSNIGPIRNLQAGGRTTNVPGYYGDCAVVAFRTPSDESDVKESHPVVTSNAGTINAAPLLDDDLNTSMTLSAAGKPGPVWIQFSFEKPFSARAITIAGRQGIPFGRVMASTDGIHFQTLAEMPGKQGYRGGTVRTYSFPEVSAKYYRVEMTNAPLKPADVISQATTPVDTAFQLSELKLYSGPRVNRWEDKAGFNFMFEYESESTPEVAAGDVIKTSDIVDLTSKMSPDGTLNWNVPEGKWTIMRFGYSLTGSKNRPAVPSGLGYEVDKLSKKHTESYIRQYTEPIQKSLGDLYGKSLQYVMMDSWEAGIQNWTDEMQAEFLKRRGYDITPFLPVLAGRVVQNAGVSDRFLWDFRRTLVDMFAENHYGTITDFLHKQGLKTYAEAGGVSLESIEDALLNKKYVDIPMGEFWVKDLHPSSMYYEDVRGAASAAHIYGKGIAGAESFTGGNYESPYTLKKISDYWFTQGINRLVFHTSAHQPLDTKPGNTMVGTHINRNITWAEKAAPFMTYLARNSYMLQKGLYVADIAYLLNEGAPSTMPFWGAGLQPACPEGYQFDYFNAD